MITPTEFIALNTVSMRPPVVPELSLHLAADSHAIFQAAHETFGAGPSQHPFWAFAWPGGQVLARHLLDHPELAKGRRVLDLGCGSAIGAIAAARAGARHVLANDIDVVACAAARLNAQANGVTLDVSDRDMMGERVNSDLILIGDTFYLPELQTRVIAFMEDARRAGATLLFGDRTTMRRPPLDFVVVDEREASVAPALHHEHVERARVWRCG